jgi:hypothetical protein
LNPACSRIGAGKFTLRLEVERVKLQRPLQSGGSLLRLARSVVNPAQREIGPVKLIIVFDRFQAILPGLIGPGLLLGLLVSSSVNIPESDLRQGIVLVTGKGLLKARFGIIDVIPS